MSTPVAHFAITGAAFAGYTDEGLAHVKALAVEQLTWDPDAESIDLLTATVTAVDAEQARRAALTS